MFDAIAALIVSAGIALVITALLLPGRQTVPAIRETGTASAKILNAVLGRG